MNITQLQAPSCRDGKQPLWDEREPALFYIDNFGQKVHRWEPATGEARHWDHPGIVTSLTLREQGGAMVTMFSGIAERRYGG
ncbi:MAG: SMP-30/gluconolactonase/LRE family protein [Novosphingobium sp.]|nr:SMP-30/gluconolactonase/LRE family protein [Novosphingobium sp.]